MEASSVEPPAEFLDKGLRPGAVGMATSIAVGMASTAPAYSLAATLGFVVAVVGLRTPLLVVVTFVPMLMTAWAIKQINKHDALDGVPQGAPADLRQHPSPLQDAVVLDAARRISARAAFSDVIVPGLSALILFVVIGWSVKVYLQPESYVEFHLLGWHVGGTMLVVIITAIIGLGWMLILQPGHKEFFSGETMRSGPSLTDDDEVVAVTPVESVLAKDAGP